MTGVGALMLPCDDCGTLISEDDSHFPHEERCPLSSCLGPCRTCRPRVVCVDCCYCSKGRTA